MQDIALNFKIGVSTVPNIVHATTRVLFEELQPRCMKFPKNSEAWRQVAEQFEHLWNFPNCLGAVDGKHIQIEAPSHSGSLYYNYKGTYSVVLMAIVDSSLRFVGVDVGAYGHQSDGGTFKLSKMGRRLSKGSLNLPPPSQLPESTTVAPYVFVGDEAFQLRPDFLRPYPGRYLEDDRRIFNYRLSRARRCVENAFGILAARWRVFRRTIDLLPENVMAVTLAACVLHNFLRNDVLYIPQNYADSVDRSGNIVEGHWRQRVQPNAYLDLEHRCSRNHAKAAADVRDKYRAYFANEGAVPWQRQRAGLRP